MKRGSLTALSLVSRIHRRNSSNSLTHPSSFEADIIPLHFSFINSVVSSELSHGSSCTGNTCRDTDTYNTHSLVLRRENYQEWKFDQSHIIMAPNATGGSMPLHHNIMSSTEEVKVVNKDDKADYGRVKMQQRSRKAKAKDKTPLSGGGRKGGNNKKYQSNMKNQNAVTDSKNTSTANSDLQKVVVKRLYRQCLRMVKQWTPEEETYVRLVQDVGELLRPLLRHLIASVRPMSKAFRYKNSMGKERSQISHRPLSVSELLRKAFEFKLPTDTEQTTDWCIHAGFAFIRRCNNKAEERQVLSSWAHVTDTTFTPLDAAILMSYIHYWFESPVTRTTSISLEPSTSARIWSPFSSAKTIMESLVPDPDSPFNLEVLEEKYRYPTLGNGSSVTKCGSGVGDNMNNDGDMKNSRTVSEKEEHIDNKIVKNEGEMIDKDSPGVVTDDRNTCVPRADSLREMRSIPAATAITTTSPKRQHHICRLTNEMLREETKHEFTKKKSIDSFSEEIFIEMERLVESCRSTIPAEELSNTDRYAKIIARSVLHHLRFDENLVAYRSFQTSASASSIHRVLKDRFGSERTIGAVYIHILSALGLRAVQLASVDLPLVCVYSTKSKGKLQFCVDLANTAVLAPTEALDAIKQMYTDCLIQHYEDQESQYPPSQSENNEEDDCEFLSNPLSNSLSAAGSTSHITIDPVAQKRFIKDLLTVSESIPLNSIQMLTVVCEDYEISPRELAMYESAQEFVRRIGSEME